MKNIYGAIWTIYPRAERLQVYGQLLSRGVYLGSIRTMYRLLAELGETKERRALRSRERHEKPTLQACAPNQVWSWDITKLAGPLPGILYCLYVIIDLFSRYVVGWLIAERENATLAQQLFAETLLRHGIEPGQIVVHSDRGSPMKSEGLGQLLGSLGISRSFSRPRVSDDNPFSEAQFKTLKYQPDYPDRFPSLPDARAYCQAFFGWHNDEHHHSGLALFTPADVFHGRVPEVAARRQAALDAAYAAHPERFPHGPPRVPMPPSKVSINPIAVAASAGLRSDVVPQSSPVDRTRPARHDARHEVESCIEHIRAISKPIDDQAIVNSIPLSTSRPSSIQLANPS